VPRQVVVRFFGDFLNRELVVPCSRLLDRASSSPVVSAVAYLSVVVAFAVFLVVDSLGDNPQRLVSGAGILVIVFFGFCFSKHPGHVRWRPVVWGVGMEFVFGMMVLSWEVSVN
jgi:pyrimidine nucleoside transport protein